VCLVAAVCGVDPAARDDAGIYFSANTSTSVGYDKGCLLLCKLLTGKTKQLRGQDRMDGKPCCTGFTSHTVDNGNCDV